MSSNSAFADRTPHVRDDGELASRRVLLSRGAVAAVAAIAASSAPARAQTATSAPANQAIVTHYRTREIDGVKIFYREAGPADAPVVLLLHGFPTSSHMFRNLIP